MIIYFEAVLFNDSSFVSCWIIMVEAEHEM